MPRFVPVLVAISVVLLAGMTAVRAVAVEPRWPEACRCGPAGDGEAAFHGGLAAGAYQGMVPDAAITALGAASCATTACHGGPQAGNRDVHSFAFTIWAKTDPHAGAYETLHDPRSQRMAELLGVGPAHRADVCLACHSMQAETPRPLPHEVLADGVACGSCHGDATLWREAHTLSSWKDRSVEERAALGYRDMTDISARVRTCVPCHVGDSTREVDHDLIAAGHPRLAFEFSAYQRLWPRHWSPAHTAEVKDDFGARSWAVGQAETLRAVAELLAVRAERSARAADAPEPSLQTPVATVWPEFAEFDCYACHRSLGSDTFVGGRAVEWRTPVPGTPAWQPWQTSAATLVAAGVDRSGPDLAAIDRGIDALRSMLAARWAAADARRLGRLAIEARALEQASARVVEDLEARDRVDLDVSPRRIDALVAARPPDWRSWDSAVQRLLALEAAAEPGPAPLGAWPSGTFSTTPPDTRAALDALRESLRFPAGQDAPAGFDPARFRFLSGEVPWNEWDPPDG
jgi:hypothetical protein